MIRGMNDCDHCVGFLLASSRAERNDTAQHLTVENLVH